LYISAGNTQPEIHKSASLKPVSHKPVEEVLA